MVIYLKIRRKQIIRIVILSMMLVILWGLGYGSVYIKYKDKEIIENEALKKELEVLKIELDNIKESLNIKVDNLDYQMAKVISRDIYHFNDEIVINLGEKEVEIGDAVINSEGLIGVVTKTMKNRSIVTLVTGSYNISVEINGTYGNLHNNIVDLLDKYANIKSGDKVYTSGLTNIPKGILIGSINEVNEDKEGLGLNGVVELLNNDNINYVAVLVGNK